MAYLQFVNKDKDRESSVDKDKDREGHLPPMCQYVQGHRRSLTSSLSIRTRTGKVTYLQFVNKDKDREGRLPPVCE